MPQLVILAKDSAALSPARGTLAALQRDRIALMAEIAPLSQQLHRCDEALAGLDIAETERNRLLADHEREVGAAIAQGFAIPTIDLVLNVSEIKYREAQQRARAVVVPRQQLEAQLAALQQRSGALGRELDEVTANVVLEGLKAAAELGYRAQSEPWRRTRDLLDGGRAWLLQNGHGRQAEALENHCRTLWQAQPPSSPDVDAVRRHALALKTDPSAELEP
jgi:hypothetical protein